MEGKKSKKVVILTFLLIIAIICLIIMGYFLYKFYNEKIKESHKAEDLNTELEQIKSEKLVLQEKIDAIENTLKTSNNTRTNTSSSEENTNTSADTNANNNTVEVSDSSNKQAQMRFESMDNAAARGNPEILQIFEYNEQEMEFEYNASIDLTNRTLRNVSGIAKYNNENAFEYSEEINGHQYKIVLEFDEKKTGVKVTEYDNENLLSYITLANVT